MADWGGFEPPTPWFVAKYSIQLSYQSAPRRRASIQKGRRYGKRLEWKKYTFLEFPFPSLARGRDQLVASGGFAA